MIDLNDLKSRVQRGELGLLEATQLFESTLAGWALRVGRTQRAAAALLGISRRQLAYHLRGEVATKRSLATRRRDDVEACSRRNRFATAVTRLDSALRELSRAAAELA
jgi:hypothetical protein